MSYQKITSRYKIKMLIPFIGIIMLISCTSQHEELKPPLVFQNEYLNTQIRLFVPSQFNTFKPSDKVATQLFFNTKNTIVFPSDYNLRLFINEDGKWKEVFERPTETIPSNNIVISNANSTTLAWVVFFPALDNKQQKYFLRAYVIGEMKTDNGTQKVASFVDIILSP